MFGIYNNVAKVNHENIGNKSPNEENHITSNRISNKPYGNPNHNKNNYNPFHNLFISSPLKKRRNSQPPELVIYKPGPFSPLTILHTLKFKWLTYLDDDPDTFDSIDESSQYNTEYTNIGLLAALVFTVWVSFQLQVIDVSKFETKFGLKMQALYAVIWTLAAGLTLYSTIGSVIMLLAINETADANEVRHLMDSFSVSTFGLGRLLPLIFLVASVLAGAAGTVLWFYCSFHSDYVAFAVLITLFSLSAIFGLFIFNLVGNLYAIRETGKAINQLPNVNIDPKLMNDLFNNYCKSVGGIEYLDSPEQFINYLRCHITADGQIINDPIEDGNKIYMKLTFLTIKFAHLYFRDMLDRKCKDMMYEATGMTTTLPVSP